MINCIGLTLVFSINQRVQIAGRYVPSTQRKYLILDQINHDRWVEFYLENGAKVLLTTRSIYDCNKLNDELLVVIHNSELRLGELFDWKPGMYVNSQFSMNTYGGDFNEIQEF